MAPDWLNAADFVVGVLGIAIGAVLSTVFHILQQRDESKRIAADVADVKAQLRGLAEALSDRVFASQARALEVTVLLAEKAAAAGQTNTSELVRHLLPEVAKLLATTPTAAGTSAPAASEPPAPSSRTASPPGREPTLEELIDIAIRLPLPLRMALMQVQPGGPFDPARRTLYGRDGRTYTIDPAEIAPLVASGFLVRSAPANMPEFANDVAVPLASSAALRLAALVFPA